MCKGSSEDAVLAWRAPVPDEALSGIKAATASHFLLSATCFAVSPELSVALTAQGRLLLVYCETVCVLHTQVHVNGHAFPSCYLNMGNACIKGQ